MTSKYYQDASSAIASEMVVAQRNAATLHRLEAKMKKIRARENRAVATIKSDEKANVLSRAEAMIEEAKVHASAMTEAETIKAQIKKLVPDWREDLIGKVRVISEKASTTMVKGAEGSGKGLGSAIRTPWQASKRFFNGITQTANQEFAAFKEEVDNNYRNKADNNS